MLLSVSQDSLAPNPVGQRAVDAGAPEDREDHHRAEPHPLGKGPADQGRSDDEEHPLEQHVGHGRDRQPGKERQFGAAGGPNGIHSLHTHVAAVADPRPVAAEDERIPVQAPDDRHHAHQADALHHDAQHVLAADQPAVEQGQGRRGHEQHQGRGDQDPGVVGGIELRCSLGGRRRRQLARRDPGTILRMIAVGARRRERGTGQHDRDPEDAGAGSPHHALAISHRGTRSHARTTRDARARAPLYCVGWARKVGNGREPRLPRDEGTSCVLANTSMVGTCAGRWRTAPGRSAVVRTGHCLVTRRPHRRGANSEGSGADWHHGLVPRPT